LPEQAYLSALMLDLQSDLTSPAGRRLNSIFIGGGTPSLLSPAAVASLLEGVSRQIDFAETIEITLEANPGAVESKAFAGYRAAGVNRLSLGVQSLQGNTLQALERVHNPQEAIRAFHQARAAGFDNINIDLMFGLPQQTLDMAKQDLLAAIELNSDHLSYYQLTLEPNTAFYHWPPELPDEETLWQMQQQGEAMLTEAGFVQYEVSAYAKPGSECRHNLNYWRFGDYLGIGAGAHGKLTQANGKVKRVWKQRHPETYLAAVKSRHFIQGERELGRGDLVVEFMMNGLRLLSGVEKELFAFCTGLSLDDIAPQVSIAIEKGLLQRDAHKFCPTPLGQRFLNDLISIFSS
jgi:oxygen-independent coproporphyrinogen-3 oxidase